MQSMEATSSLQKNRQEGGSWDSSKVRARLRLISSWTMRWCRKTALIGRTGPVLGGHARPRQSFEDRKSLLRDTEGRQNGNDLHVLRGAEETQFSTAGKCTGNVTTSKSMTYRVGFVWDGCIAYPASEKKYLMDMLSCLCTCSVNPTPDRTFLYMGGRWVGHIIWCGRVCHNLRVRETQMLKQGQRRTE